MGVVYLAEDPAIGRLVAIKTIRLEELSDPGQALRLHDRLLREARSAGILSHPNIVTIYDIQQIGELASIVMEYVDGCTLYERMQQGALPLSEVFQILAQAAAALDYAHSKGVLHRDIKPANLMLARDGQVKITDFGIARLTSQQTATSSMVVGTPSYMAPEQVANKPLSPATDQFGLAVITYEMLTGKKPFAADSIATLLYSIVFQEPAPLAQSKPELPEALDLALRKALSKNPAERYCSCTEFVTALRSACQVQPATMRATAAAAAAGPSFAPGPTASVCPTAMQPPPLQETAKPRRFRLVWLVAALLPVVLLAALVVARFRPQVPAPPEPDTAQSTAGSSGPPSTSPTPLPAPIAKPRSPAGAAKPSVNQPVEQEPLQAPVEFRTQPAGATVEAAGVRCYTPCELLLPHGEHKATLTLEGFKQEHRIIRVPEQTELRVELRKPSGTLLIKGPVGALIYIEGVRWSQPAPAQIPLPPGIHRVAIEVDGVRSAEVSVLIEDGKYTEQVQ